MDAKANASHVEICPESAGPPNHAQNVTGTVRITDEETVFLIPAPTADPRVAGSMISGFGSLLPFYRPDYAKSGISAAQISQLVSYPPLFMGIGNLIFVPLAAAIGRRPVFLLVAMITILGGFLCAFSTNWAFHNGARMVLGLGAGLGEALIPMMVADIHFLHERSTSLMWQSGIQGVVSTVLVLCASPIAGAVGPQRWYIIGSSLMCMVLLAGIFLIPESKYPRTQQSTIGIDPNGVGKAGQQSPMMITLDNRPPFDTVHFAPRTLWSDMRLMSHPAEWQEIANVWLKMAKIFFSPVVFWAFTLNGAALGAMISISATQASVVIAPPYSWSANAVSFLNAGQIIVAFIAVPLLGYGSDAIIKMRAKRNGGIHEPESRLLPLIIPLVFGIIALIVYGCAGSFPRKVHWIAVVLAVPTDFFSFVGCNIVAITYLLDSFPNFAAPILILITAVRGFVGFGFSYIVTDFVARAGYIGCFGTYAGINFALGIVGAVIFFTGKRLRAFTAKYI
ncbi:MFS general substrate transporter [Thozetella sp. PMI_491]|nr:MFS general substrate transporter [Thozetella sp. PMI_491]